MKINELLKKGAESLKESNFSYHDCIVDVTLILCHVLKVDKIYLVINKDKEVDFSDEINFFHYVEKRKEKMPIAYITNHCEFMGIDFFVNDKVLIPRPDTEILVEQVMTFFDKDANIKILDLCCGSGCIGLSLSKYYVNSKVDMIDLSYDALKVAKKNSENFRNVEIKKADALKFFSEFEYDILVSNPPYIPLADYLTLDENVKDYEPKLALVAENEGLHFYETIIKNCKAKYMAFEVGIGQSKAVADMFDHSFNTEIFNDLSGIERVVVAKYVNIC